MPEQSCTPSPSSTKLYSKAGGRGRPWREYLSLSLAGAGSGRGLCSQQGVPAGLTHGDAPGAAPCLPACDARRGTSSRPSCPQPSPALEARTSWSTTKDLIPPPQDHHLLITIPTDSCRRVTSTLTANLTSTTLTAPSSPSSLSLAHPCHGHHHGHPALSLFPLFLSYDDECFRVQAPAGSSPKLQASPQADWVVFLSLCSGFHSPTGPCQAPPLC